jgi:arginine decarboxylase
MKHNVNLETSSSFDIDLILKLYEKKELNKTCIIVHNGYKTDDYLQKIMMLQDKGFKSSVIILDSVHELDRLLHFTSGRKVKIGLRMAIDEEPQSAYYTSRLGIRPSELLNFFREKIRDNPNIEFEMLHFFVDSGIRDTLYYWGEFKKALDMYIELKKECPKLRALNLGGGLPIRNHLGFEYDYEYMIQEIVRNIKEACTAAGIEDPDLYTEFGKYTVGESGAIIFKVLDQK